ncbi:MAG: Ada metal-binding domain-containing protein, partial [Phycisphaerae bacterium]
MNTLPNRPEMERATLDRDTSYDGIFIVAVRTTGIFCRPSCPAKKPLARNVEYFPTARDALLGGYRPCKRCRPMDSNGQPPEWVDRLFSYVD